MPEQPLSIAMHIGVHKTASSHLQRCLKKASDDLAAQGVRYYGPDHFRLPGRSIPALFGFQGEKPPPADPARSPAMQLATLVKDAHRLVLSEENFIGVLNNPRGRAVRQRYKSAGPRLSALAAAVGQDVDVFVALRRPTSFLNSAYGQMLMGGQLHPAAVFLRRNPPGSVDWYDLVMRLRKARGVGRVVVWRYEDYNALFAQITAELVGPAQAHLVPHVQRRINVGLSAAAVADVMQRAKTDPVEKMALAARKMLPVDADHPPFDGYSPQDHALSDAAYAAQMRAIAALDGVTVLTPENRLIAT